MDDRAIRVFENPEFGNVRVLCEDGRYLFCGSDVGRALGYTNPRKAIADHCKGVTKRDTPTGGGTQSVSFITEGDVYRLITQSKMPDAQRFEKWVFDDVLPGIRRSGAFMTDATIKNVTENPELIFALARQLLSEKEGREKAEQELCAAKPKADVYDALVDSGRTTSIRVAAKEYGIGERVFVRWCVEKKFLYRTGAGMLMPYANMKKKEWFRVMSYGTIHGYHGSHVVLTQKGKAEIWSELQKDGIIKENQDGNVL